MMSFRKQLIRVMVMVLVCFFLASIWYWDSSEPNVDWSGSLEVVGSKTKIHLIIQDEDRGLKSIEVALLQLGKRQIVQSENYSPTWFWQNGELRRPVNISIEALLGEGELSEGEFWLEIIARDHPNWWLWSREIFERQRFVLDLTPPNIELLSTQHYIRQGGSEAISYRVSKDTVASGVQVGERIFRGTLLQGGRNSLCLFALAHDQSIGTDMWLWAEDAAGNRSRINFWKKVFPVRSRSRRIFLSTRFINKVTTEISDRANRFLQEETPLKTFLKINGRLRQINHQKIENFTQNSAPQLLWNQSFLQLSNSKVESAFADHRSYYYRNKKVDEQTHLGFDLASVANSPIESGNDGIVVYADYLGIYGNCVLVDHGLGLFSLYGHLSQIEVQTGQSVERGQILGSTGQTGLAGGDHLHFSIFLQGVQVNPLEWWDQRWVEQHVLSKSLATD